MRIALWGNFGTSNFGNECTLAAAILSLRQQLPGVQLLAICTEPEDTSRRHGLDAIPIFASDADLRDRRSRLSRGSARLSNELRHWRAAVRVLADVDLLVVAGTGVITDADEGALGTPYQLFKWCTAARISRCKVAYVSVGVEAIGRRVSAMLLRCAMRHAHFRSFRDELSRRRLLEAGFPVAADPIFPDLAFSLPAPHESITTEAVQEPVLGIGLFNYRNSGVGDVADHNAFNAYVDEICSLTRWALDNGLAVQILIGDGLYDETVRKAVRQRLNEYAEPIDVARFRDHAATSYEEIVSQLGRCTYVVASRFHNVLLALMLGRPTISISYEEKNDELMSAFGFQSFCYPIARLRVDAVVERLRLLQHAGDTFRRTVEQLSAQYRERLSDQYSQLARLVETP
jgi:polysaccharide pyruvyl transferase WcaK-like protein